MPRCLDGQCKVPEPGSLRRISDHYDIDGHFIRDPEHGAPTGGRWRDALAMFFLLAAVGLVCWAIVGYPGV